MYHTKCQLSQSFQSSFCPLFFVALTLIAGFLSVSCAIGQIPIMSAADTANAYYQAIESRDYAKAYTYLSPYYPVGAHEALSRAGFIASLQATDASSGPVTSYTLSGSAANNGVVVVIMSVTRRGQSSQTYDVQLQLQQSKGTWQIINEDCSQFNCPL